jgi:hypothetical protein
MRGVRALPGVLLLTACATLESTAREKLVHEATCPADRVTVTNAPPEEPPDYIAADPGRLTIWNKDASERASHRFVVSGCGRETHYYCETQHAESASWPECNEDAMEPIRD